jgi:hypothetical protein
MSLGCSLMRRPGVRNDAAQQGRVAECLPLQGCLIDEGPEFLGIAAIPVNVMNRNLSEMESKRFLIALPCEVARVLVNVGDALPRLPVPENAVLRAILPAVFDIHGARR